MKTLILTVLALTTAPAMAAEDGFTCFSRWYRDAELTVNSGVIRVQDSYMAGAEEVRKILQKELKLERAEYIVNTVALHVDREEGVSCRAAGLLADCQGGAVRPGSRSRLGNFL